MMSVGFHVTACSELVCYTRTPVNKKADGHIYNVFSLLLNDYLFYAFYKITLSVLFQIQ